jgi:aldehyde:ferredoxin oxidoreductase
MEEFASGVDEFYILRGWDPANGLPTKETLLKLGLKCVASDMESRSLLS